MTLFWITIVVGMLILGLGWWFLTLNGEKALEASRVLRSNTLNILLFVPAALWFLWKVGQLGPADFGEYKNILLMLFGGIAVGALFYVKDFLCVRGGAALVLMGAQIPLDAAYFVDSSARLVLVTVTYLAILVALYFAAVPYKMRDLLYAIEKKVGLGKKLGGSLLGVGGILIISAFLG